MARRAAPSPCLSPVGSAAFAVAVQGGLPLLAYQGPPLPHTDSPPATTPTRPTMARQSRGSESQPSHGLRIETRRSESLSAISEQRRRDHDSDSRRSHGPESRRSRGSESRRSRLLPSHGDHTDTRGNLSPARPADDGLCAPRAGPPRRALAPKALTRPAPAASESSRSDRLPARAPPANLSATGRRR